MFKMGYLYGQYDCYIYTFFLMKIKLVNICKSECPFLVKTKEEGRQMIKRLIEC